MALFKNKILLITGGTGSFGNAVLMRFLNNDIVELQRLSITVGQGCKGNGCSECFQNDD